MGEGAAEVSAKSQEQGKDSGDGHGPGHIRFAADGVELLHHLGQRPRAEARDHDQRQQREPAGRAHRQPTAGPELLDGRQARRGGGIGHQLARGADKPADFRPVRQQIDHDQDPGELDDPADEIAHRHREVSAHHQVHRRERGEKVEGAFVGDVQGHFKEVAQAHQN